MVAPRKGIIWTGVLPRAWHDSGMHFPKTQSEEYSPWTFRATKPASRVFSYTMNVHISERMQVPLLSAVALFLGVSFVVLFYKHAIGVNFPVFIVFAIGGGVLLAVGHTKNIQREVVVLLLLSVFFSGMVFIRSGELITFFNVLATVYLSFLAIAIFVRGGFGSFLIRDYVKPLLLPFRFIRPFFETLSFVVSLDKEPHRTTQKKEVIRGTLVAIPLIGLFSLLFASADPIFHEWVSRIFSFDLDEEFWHRVILCAFVTAFFLGAFGYMLRKIHPMNTPISTQREGGLGETETTIVLLSISALFAIFILLQLAYLFGGQGELMENGLTYAEYARAGFFQLLFVAMLSFFIISFAEGQIIRRAGRHIRSFQLLSGTLVAEVLLILSSAFSRLSLYEGAYGFTDTRLYSHALMIAVGVMYAILLWHIITNGPRPTLAFRILCVPILLLLSMNLLDPDVFIVRQNLARYEKTWNIDAMYLAQLSPDALPETISLLQNRDERVRSAYAEGLRIRYPEIFSGRTPDTWQSLRRSTGHARSLLLAHKDEIEEYGVSRAGENPSLEP